MRPLLLLIAIITSIAGCSSGPHYSPKPRGYFRIEFPEKKYQLYDAVCPFRFNYPTYSTVVKDSSTSALPCWLNIDFQPFNSTLHISYYPVASRKALNELIEDAHTFAFKHTVKATSIDEGRIEIPENRVYGLYYTIGGNTASAIQFFLTDSTSRYIRGALYFNEEPRADSIKPVLNFIKDDIDVMIKSFRWQ